MTEQHGKNTLVPFSPEWSLWLWGNKVPLDLGGDIFSFLGSGPTPQWGTHRDGDPTDLTNITTRPPRVGWPPAGPRPLKWKGPARHGVWRGHELGTRLGPSVAHAAATCSLSGM